MDVLLIVIGVIIVAGVLRQLVFEYGYRKGKKPKPDPFQFISPDILRIRPLHMTVEEFDSWDVVNVSSHPSHVRYTRTIDDKKIVVRLYDSPQSIYHELPEHRYYRIDIAVDGNTRPEVSGDNHKYMFYNFCKPLRNHMRHKDEAAQMKKYSQALTETLNEPIKN